MVGTLTSPEAPVRYLLVVEDHDGMRDRLVQLLSAGLSGLLVRGVDSGESALAFAAEHEPVAAVIDIGLPGIDGVTTTRRLLDRAPGVAVVVISMNASALHQAAALEAGAACFVDKPSVVDRLLPALMTALASGNP